MRFASPLIILLLILGCCSCRQQDSTPQPLPHIEWRQSIDQILPLYGHRNWILVVDKAFPALAASSGMQVINTGADMPTVLAYLYDGIKKMPHMKTQIFMDKEFGFMPAATVKGFKDTIHQIFSHVPVKYLLHDTVFTDVATTAKQFQVLILKTNSCLAYSSVYFQLDCKYWDAAREMALREAMKRAE